MISIDDEGDDSAELSASDAQIRKQLYDITGEEGVLPGEEVIIGKAGKPVAKLVPYQQSDAPRKGGQWRGKVQIAADFDELPADLLAAFNGENP